MPALVVVADVGRRRIIDEVGRAIEEHAWRPEVLRLLRPRGLLRKRVAEMLPADEVLRAGDLDIDPLAIAQRLSRVGVITAVRRLYDRRVGKILVEDRVHVTIFRGRGPHGDGRPAGAG